LKRKAEELFFNRELNRLEFNCKVLQEAADRGNPLLERVRFLAIFYSNFDEFFMVRVAGLTRQYKLGVESRSIDGLSPLEQLKAVRRRTGHLLNRAAVLWRKTLKPELFAEGLKVLNYANFSYEEDEADDLLAAVRDVLDQRRFGEVVRLETLTEAPKHLVKQLVGRFGLEPFQTFAWPGPLGGAGLMDIADLNYPALKYPDFKGRKLKFPKKKKSFFSQLGQGDIFLYHPYDSFNAVLDFIREAAADSDFRRFEHHHAPGKKAGPPRGGLLSGPEADRGGHAPHLGRPGRFPEDGPGLRGGRHQGRGHFGRPGGRKPGGFRAPGL
jgi:polyphosphate kinase